MLKAFPITNGMKILFTGGGSGGHFYPIIAVAQAINDLSKERHLVPPKLYYMAPEPYNEGLLFENKIIFKYNPAGKVRRYFSLLNLSDIFKTGLGIIKSIWTIFNIYPDVIFGKGGYGSFPVLLSARILRIPVIIHESDSVPGKVNRWAGKFARRIAVSYKETSTFFPKEKVAYTGQPLRKEFRESLKEGAREFLNLEVNVPIIMIIGGSLGSQTINDTVILALPQLLSKYQIIHQTGKDNFEEVKSRAGAEIENSSHKERYRPFDYLNGLALRMSAGVADLIVSRAGSAIFEISSWAKPSVIIPITDSNGDHQRKNAFNYGRAGAAIVIEETNLTPNILVSEINRLFENREEMKKMALSAENFSKKDGAEVIAREIIDIALEHEV